MTVALTTFNYQLPQCSLQKDEKTGQVSSENGVGVWGRPVGMQGDTNWLAEPMESTLEIVSFDRRSK